MTYSWEWSDALERLCRFWGVDPNKYYADMQQEKLDFGEAGCLKDLRRMEVTE